MNKVNILPVCTGCDWDTVVDNCGSQIWPLSTQDEYDSLLKYASIFGVSLKKITKKHIRKKHIEKSEHSDYYLNKSSSNYVIANKEFETIAKLYAHLTNSKYLLTDNTSDLYQFTGAAVWIVARNFLDKLDSELLIKLQGKESIPGLLVVNDNTSIRKQLLLSSAALHLNTLDPKSKNNIISFDGQSDHNLSDYKNIQYFNRLSSSNLVKNAFLNGSNCITIKSHSDGIDSFLGEDLTICPLTDELLKLGKTNKKSIYCIETGKCYRHMLPTEDAIKSNLTLSCNKIRTKILILTICHGILGKKGLYDPIFSLFDQILARGIVGSILIPWGVVGTTNNTITNLLNTLESKKILGRSVSLHNISSIKNSSRVLYLLFGDNRITLKESNSAAFKPLKRRNLPSQKKQNDNYDSVGAAFLGSFLSNASSVKDRHLSELALKALEGVTLYRHVGSNGIPVEDQENKIGEVMRGAVLDYIAAQGVMISHSWVSLVEYRSIQRKDYCISCHALVDEEVSQFHDITLSPRAVSYCRNCGIIKDAPFKSNIKITKKGNYLHLKNCVVRGEWAAIGHINCQDESLNTSFLWPTGSNGLPKEKIKLRMKVPPGGIYFSFAIIDRASLSIATCI